MIDEGLTQCKWTRLHADQGSPACCGAGKALARAWPQVQATLKHSDPFAGIEALTIRCVLRLLADQRGREKNIYRGLTW